MELQREDNLGSGTISGRFLNTELRDRMWIIIQEDYIVGSITEVNGQDGIIPSLTIHLRDGEFDDGGAMVVTLPVVSHQVKLPAWHFAAHTLAI